MYRRRQVRVSLHALSLSGAFDQKMVYVTPFNVKLRTCLISTLATSYLSCTVLTSIRRLSSALAPTCYEQRRDTGRPLFLLSQCTPCYDVPYEA